MKNLKRIVFFLLLSNFVVTVFAQTPPDFDAIKKEISKKKSEFFYEDLMNRYKSGDTSLTNTDFHYLYYGYTFQPQFAPYDRCAALDKQKPYFNKEELTLQDCDSIIKYAEICLDFFPFDIRQMNNLGYVYIVKEQFTEATFWLRRANSILETILASGEGTTKESALYVITVTHEYDILEALQLRSTTQSLIQNKYDYMEVSANDRNIKGLYFNIECFFGKF